MPKKSPAFTRSAAFAVGEEQCLCVDINCHRKSITVPVTVVLGPVATPGLLRAVPRNPRQMTFCCGKTQDLGSGTCTSVSASKFGPRRCGPACGRGTLNSEEHLTLRLDAKKHQIRTYYRALFQAWGPQHWWPAQSRFEVIVGAYLTQNTAWTNVEKALTNLRSARLLSVRGIRRVSLAELERLMGSAPKLPIPSCCTPATIQYSWWTPTRAGFSLATRFFRKKPLMTRFGNCLSERWRPWQSPLPTQAPPGINTWRRDFPALRILRRR